MNGAPTMMMYRRGRIIAALISYAAKSAMNGAPAVMVYRRGRIIAALVSYPARAP